MNIRARWAIAGLLLTMCTCVNAHDRTPTASDVVTAYAKQIDIAKIDDALKSNSLEMWLSSRELHLDHIRWSRGDCDIRPDEPPSKRDYPLCVRIDFRSPNGRGWMSIKIGTIHKGIHGEPGLLHCVVKSDGFPPQGAFHEVKKLSDLPAVLAIVEAEVRRR